MGCGRQNNLLFYCMSDQTNKELFYETIHMLPHVGDNSDASRESDYVRTQLDLIKDSRKRIPPTISLNGRDIGYTDKSDEEYLKDKVRIDTGVRLNTYEPLKNNRYDPYIGYLYNEGLLEDSGTVRYVSHYVNINSAHRNKEPIVETDEVIILSENPLNFNASSNSMFISHPNHDFIVNDRITLTGAATSSTRLKSIVSGSNGYDFVNGSSYMKINMTHGIDLSYAETSILVDISGVVGNIASGTSSYVNNIPVNIINKCHVVYLVPSDPAFPGSEIASPNAFYVLLTRQFISTSPFVPVSHSFTVKFLAIGGVPLNVINAEYPIDTDHLNGFHIIRSISDFGYTVQLDQTAAYSPGPAGGTNVKVGKILNIETGYPRPNNYEISLGNVFHNVISVKLISSEFPNTRLAIMDGENANNKLYWNNLDDGTHLYSLEIEPGNYTPAELITELEAKFAATERINFAIDNADPDNQIVPPYTNTHFVKMEIETTSNIVKFTSFREIVLSKPIVETDPVITEGTDVTTLPQEVAGATFTLTFEHSAHGLSVGDVILVQNAITHLGIPSAVINGEHAITEVVSPDRYRFQLSKFNLGSGVADTGGGQAVSVFTPNIFRLRFDESDTVGDLLGFRNVGESTSIYDFSNEITNQDLYQFEQPVNSLGETIDVKQNFLQLSGDDYVLMVTDKISNLTSTGPIKSAFAKIILCDIPGKTIYNSFVKMHPIKQQMIPEIESLEFSFYATNGAFYNFHDIDHSFTLEIITTEELPKGSNISARSGRVNTQGVAT